MSEVLEEVLAPRQWLGRPATDDVVESATPLRCTHFDAFRFFIPDAVPRNAGTPSRAFQHDWEQPGCLHTNMDLYKWCSKLVPTRGAPGADGR